MAWSWVKRFIKAIDVAHDAASGAIRVAAPELEPVRGGFAITPHDTNTLAAETRMIYVGVAGDVKVTLADGDTVTLANVPAGFWPLAATVVWAAGTTATDLVGLY